mgnify:CR=1 FL=1
MRFVVSVALAAAAFAALVRAQLPQPYCTAGLSSNFCTPSISANASPDTANTAGCGITESGVPGLRQGLVFYGIDNSGFTPSPWGGALGSSFLCVKPPVARLGPPQSSGGLAGTCNGAYVIDWDAFQNANPTALGAPWSAWDKVFAQSWYRDPLAPKTSHLSNALELTVTPPRPVPCVTTIPGMVVIPAGTFQMGSDAASGAPYHNNPISQPVHTVTISSCFWMSATEVTQAEYSALMGLNPSQYSGANKPVERVSWFDAVAYCAVLTAQQSALGNVPTGYQYRLPTEAEWEYACRAGTSTEFNVGAALWRPDAMVSYSWHLGWACWTWNGQYPGPDPVSSYAPNAWGLYDMHGNVWEWRLDTHASYSPGAVTDPFVNGGPGRIVRGGSWYDASDRARSGNREGQASAYVSDRLGFRVVLAPILVL